MIILDGSPEAAAIDDYLAQRERKLLRKRGEADADIKAAHRVFADVEIELEQVREARKKLKAVRAT